MPMSCAEFLRERLGAAFEGCYRDLAGLYGDDLTDEIVLNELAEFLADAVMSPFADDRTIEQCCSALDELCEAPGIDAMAMIYGQVLALLPPTVLERSRSYFGPAVEHLLEELEMAEPT